MRKLLFIFMLTCCASGTLFAQDPQFTQFYAAPTYLNPAFTGNTLQSRVGLNYRNQWPAIPGAFVTYNFSYEQFVRALNSGLGINITQDRAGSGGLRFSEIKALYSYEIKIDRDIAIRPGMSFGYGIKDINFYDLLFGDQLVRPDGSPTLEYYENRMVSFFDVGTGMLVYGRKFWGGVAAHHLNKPNESLLIQESILPIKLSVHGGYRMPVNNRGKNWDVKALVYAFNYKAQADYDQLDLGFYYEFDPIVFGVWYRGLPGLKKQPTSILNHDAVSLLIGYQNNEIKFGYSYDLTISNLVINTAGSHELSLIYEFANPNNSKYSKRKRIIPCAKF